MSDVPIHSYTVEITAVDTARNNAPIVTAIFTTTAFNGQGPHTVPLPMYDAAGDPKAYQLSADPKVPESAKWRLDVANVDPRFTLFGTACVLDLTRETRVTFVVTPAHAHEAK